MPKFFEIYGRKETQTQNHVPASFAYGHPEWGYYEMLKNYPERMKRFMPAMAAIEARMPIAGIYDFEWLVTLTQNDPTPERTVFVDIGGGKGQAIKAISKEYPGLPLKRFVLEDRPEVIEAVGELDEPELREAKKLAIDFHKEQPIKGIIIRPDYGMYLDSPFSEC